MNIKTLEFREAQHAKDALRLKKLIETKGFASDEAKEAESKRFMAEHELLAWHRKAYDAGKSELDSLVDSNGPVADANFGFTERDLKSLHAAMKNKLPTFAIEAKAPFGSGSFTSGSLPSILLPQNTLALPIDETDVFASFVQETAPEAHSVEYLSHTGNTNPAVATAELGALPDLGMTWTTKTVNFTDVGATQTFSANALQDVPSFIKIVPAEMHQALKDAVNNQVLNANGTAPNPTGLLNTSATLTHSQAATEDGLVAIRAAKAAIRTGSSFGSADTVIMHPADWAAAQMIRVTPGNGTTTAGSGLFVLDPLNPERVGSISTIFGMDVIETHWCPQGTAVVYDRKKAALSWTRMAPTLEINQYGTDVNSTNLWSQRAVSFRIWTRVAWAPLYPTAINIVTGLTFTQ